MAPKAMVLVLEDEALIAMDVESMLLDAGFAVAIAESVQQARRRLALNPSIALLDILLPDGTCFDLARELVAKGIEVIFLTGYSPGIPPDLAHCAVIEKPFTADALLSAIEAIGGGTNGAAPN